MLPMRSRAVGRGRQDPFTTQIHAPALIHINDNSATRSMLGIDPSLRTRSINRHNTASGLPQEHRVMRKRLLSLTVLALTGAAFATQVSAQDTVTAVKVIKAPDLAAGTADPAWAKAEALSVRLFGGANFKGGTTTAS